jgi:DNA polymerase III epsilon subunit-like protein
MKLPPLPLVVLDTETTGFVPKVHRVIEFASMEARDGKMTEEYEQLFQHDEVPPTVEVLTRIKTPDLQNKPSFAETEPTIRKHLPEDALLVGQNIPFDIGMLKGEGIDLTARPWIDTSMLASLVFPELESYSLGYLSKVLELNHDPPHRALGDVRATAELLAKCWERLQTLPKELQDLAAGIMERAPEGYKKLFSILPKATAKKDPAWLRWKEDHAKDAGIAGIDLPSADKGKPTLMDEPLDPSHLISVIEGALKGKSTRTWIAVKNLHATLRTLPESVIKKIRVLYPPHVLIDVDAVLRNSEQKPKVEE